MLTDLLTRCQEWLFETLIQPLMFHAGLSSFLEDAYDGTLWLLAGVIQIIVIIGLIGPLERWRPVEAVTDRRSVRLDVVYTLIHRLGLFRIALFFTIDPLWDALTSKLHLSGLDGWHLDQLWVGVTDVAWVSLILYLLVFDLVDYFYHRAQHRFRWLWALHAVHHSQRQMTMWSDNRNHLLDDVIRDSLIVLVSQLIGVPPGQFILIVAIMQLVETFSHANLRMSFGGLGQRLLVGPKFHRKHHSIHYDASEPGPKGGYNFAVLFPLWDLLFRTARYDGDYEPTGIHDQTPQHGSRDYGQGFFSQHWLALKRMVGIRGVGWTRPPGRRADPHTVSPADTGDARPGA